MATRRKIFAFFLLVIFSLNTTIGCELVKLPSVFHHFLDHKSDDKSISFLTYLLRHYYKEKPDNDFEKDKKLPYKSLTYLQHGPIASVPTYISNETEIKCTLFSKASPIIPAKFSLPAKFPGAIFHPPRIC